MFRRSRGIYHRTRGARNRELAGNFTLHNVGHHERNEGAVNEACLSFTAVKVVCDLAISQNLVGENGGGERVETREEYVVVGVELVLGD